MVFCFVHLDALSVTWTSIAGCNNVFFMTFMPLSIYIPDVVFLLVFIRSHEYQSIHTARFNSNHQSQTSTTIHQSVINMKRNNQPVLRVWQRHSKANSLIGLLSEVSQYHPPTISTSINPINQTAAKLQSNFDQWHFNGSYTTAHSSFLLFLGSNF